VLLSSMTRRFSTVNPLKEIEKGSPKALPGDRSIVVCEASIQLMLANQEAEAVEKARLAAVMAHCFRLWILC
jgi:hypothetical protein